MNKNSMKSLYSNFLKHETHPCAEHGNNKYFWFNFNNIFKKILAQVFLAVKACSQFNATNIKSNNSTKM